MNCSDAEPHLLSFIHRSNVALMNIVSFSCYFITGTGKEEYGMGMHLPHPQVKDESLKLKKICQILILKIKILFKTLNDLTKINLNFLDSFLKHQIICKLSDCSSFLKKSQQHPSNLYMIQITSANGIMVYHMKVT